MNISAQFVPLILWQIINDISRTIVPIDLNIIWTLQDLPEMWLESII